jgi:hypothetical protein
MERYRNNMIIYRWMDLELGHFGVANDPQLGKNSDINTLRSFQFVLIGLRTLSNLFTITQGR